jgi:hypothetical protein
MPTHRVGREIQQDPIRLKNLLAQADEHLVAGGLRTPDVQQLLEPAQALLVDGLFWEYQSDGLAMFISSDTFRCYRLPFDFRELVVVADRFHLKPLLPLLAGDGRFYVLALSQSEIRLLQGTRYSVSPVNLERVPESLDQVLKWSDPEKRLQFHTTTRTPGGERVRPSVRTERPAIFHGHGVASADDPKDYILRYFHRVDEGLSDVLGGERAPLVLAGVDYLHPIYRDANTYPHLLDQGIEGSPEELSAKELHEQAWAVVQPLFLAQQEQAAALYTQLAGTGSERSADRVEHVAPAAYVGRVETLFVALGLQQWGTFDPQTNAVHLHQQPQPGDEDLLDFAAIHTLLNGGTVYAVDPHKVPGHKPLAALFRY